MRVVVADRSVHLRQQRDAGNRVDRGREAHRDIGELLADRRRGRGLAMGAREHRQFGMAVREFAQQRVNAAQTALQHEAAALQHQRVRDVVDVLGRAGEVDELRRVGQCRHVLRAAPDEVFHRLDVVVGLGLDRLDLGAVLDVEIGDELAQARLGLARQPWQLGQAEHRQVDEPFDLDPQPLAHERVFGEDFAQLGSLAAVAAVQRRKCGQGEQFEGHGGSADTGTRRGSAQSGATSVAKQHHSPACSACGHRACRGCRYTGLSLPCKIFACVKEHPPAGFADQPVRAQGAHRHGREAHRLPPRARGRVGAGHPHSRGQPARQSSVPDHGRRRRGIRLARDLRVPRRHDARRQADSALGTGARRGPHLGSPRRRCHRCGHPGAPRADPAAARAAGQGLDRAPDGKGSRRRRRDEPRRSARSPGATAKRIRWPTSRSGARWAIWISASARSTGAASIPASDVTTRSWRLDLPLSIRSRRSSCGQPADAKPGPIRSIRSVQKASTPQRSSARARRGSLTV